MKTPSATTSWGGFIGGLRMCARLGGCMVESNQGHIGDDIDPKGGDDPTLYGHRASAEAARLSKFVAAQVYGQAPAPLLRLGRERRRPALAAVPRERARRLGRRPAVRRRRPDRRARQHRQDPGRADDVVRHRCSTASGSSATRSPTIADAMAPGGHGDPFVGLDTHQREELASLYRLGFPRGDEFMIGQPLGQMWLWTSMAESL